MPTLLLIGDTDMAVPLRCPLQGDGVTIVTADTAAAGLAVLERQSVEAVLLVLPVPDMLGLQAFTRLHQFDPLLSVLILARHGTAEMAAESASLGAFAYLPTDGPLHTLLLLLREALGWTVTQRRLATSPQPQAEEPPESVGSSPAIQEAYNQIARFAPSDVAVLLRGETGTGKELAAQAIHRYSRRCDGPFVAVNCAAIPETLLESELFGHEKGAFTGADRQRKGRFESADKGTLFLDEVGDMPLAVQIKLLRVLQEGCFARVGGNALIAADVRVVSATNRNLEALVAAGDFREDFFHRLDGVTIRLPPLRERRDDLRPLVEQLLRRFNRELGKAVTRVEEGVWPVLEAYPWPGNVRELENVICQGVLCARTDVLKVEFLPEGLQGHGATVQPLPHATEPESAIAALTGALCAAGENWIYHKVMALVEEAVVLEVLRRMEGNQARAAKALGISRTTLRTKLRQFAQNKGHSA
jgi:two-component system nitrogen regulation response regulator GlnG